MRTIIVLCTVITLSVQEMKYTGFRVYRLYPTGINQINFLAKLSKSKHIDFWTPLTLNGNLVDVMVTAYWHSTFEKTINREAIKYELLTKDYKKLLKKERLQRRSIPRKPNGKISFTKYHTHGEINAYLDRLAERYSNFVSVETIGKSYEGRDLKVIRISKNPNIKKPTIFIDAGMHAREWIAPAQAIFTIYQLVHNPINSHLTNNVDYHILPVANPDGYEYSRTSDRLWRKTRSMGTLCIGTDPNRNFDFHWGEIGASNDQCAQTYMGTSGFSEVETQAIRNYILKYKKTIKLYLTFHSYGNFILYPWGFTYTLPSNANELRTLAEKVANAIYKVNGTKYTVGSAANVIYAAAGGSDDWARGIAGIDLSYTIELPGGGVVGFDLPPNQILPVVKETWEGLKVFHNYIKQKFKK